MPEHFQNGGRVLTWVMGCTAGKAFQVHTTNLRGQIFMQGTRETFRGFGEEQVWNSKNHERVKSIAHM